MWNKVAKDTLPRKGEVVIARLKARSAPIDVDVNLNRDKHDKVRVSLNCVMAVMTTIVDGFGNECPIGWKVLAPSAGSDEYWLGTTVRLELSLTDITEWISLDHHFSASALAAK